MDPITEKIRKWERVEKKVNVGIVVSIEWCLLMIILLNNTHSGMIVPKLLKPLYSTCQYIMENALVWVVGIIFLFYLVIVALGMMIGVNLGPKDHIE